VKVREKMCLPLSFDLETVVAAIRKLLVLVDVRSHTSSWPFAFAEPVLLCDADVFTSKSVVTT